MANVFKGDASTIPDASTSVKGISKTSAAPASPTNPIVVGDNDTRVMADQAAGTASIRTLGTGAQQAPPGNDSRFSTAASETVVGHVELATDAETQTGTDTARAITPSNLSARTALDTRTGVVELATNAETTTGTDTARATTPANVKAALDARLSSVRDFAYQGTLTTVTGTLRVPIHQAGTITSIRAMVNTAPTGAAIIVDVNINGTTAYSTQGNRPTIAVSTNSVNATLPNTTALAAGDYLTVDIDQIGSTIPGSNLVVSIRYSY